MTSVFIGGSRRITSVDDEVARRLANIVRKGLRVLIGDAAGFDRAAQDYLARLDYLNVSVYCTAGTCRNNVGNWPLCAVDFHGRGRGLQFYTAKDDAMLRDADFGLFAWDGKSKGTLRNIRRMAELNKPAAVYVEPTHAMVTVRTVDDLTSLNLDVGNEARGSVGLFSDTWRATG